MDPVTKAVLTKAHDTLTLVKLKDNDAEASRGDRLLTDDQLVHLEIALESISDILTSAGVTIGA